MIPENSFRNSRYYLCFEYQKTGIYYKKPRSEVSVSEESKQKIGSYMSPIEVENCKKCERLVEFRSKIALEKKLCYREEEYWGKPVPSFGDKDAALLICGLAPAAHGGNRTGRMFTGDRSGDFLYEALWRHGYANQANSTSGDDGLRLRGAYITAVVRCAPPDNKPLPEERENCIPFLREELLELKNLTTILALGAFAYDVLWRLYGTSTKPDNSHSLLPDIIKKPKFRHGLEIQLDTKVSMICSYHPSQRNVFTKLLTKEMFDEILLRCRALSSDNRGEV